MLKFADRETFVPSVRAFNSSAPSFSAPCARWLTAPCLPPRIRGRDPDVRPDGTFLRPDAPCAGQARTLAVTPKNACGTAANGITVNRPAKPVLVVEDHDDTREMVELCLRLDGYHVSTAADGADALARVGQEPPCLILLDVTMPVMDGIAFARALRQSSDPQLAATPIILLTAVADVKDALTQTGALAAIVKPISVDRMMEEVARHCGA
jgi:CheY-like chemotaxis protein